MHNFHVTLVPPPQSNSIYIDEEDIKFTPNDCVIIASIRLPLKAVKDKDGKFKLVSSGSLLFSQMYNLKEKSLIKALWIGIPSYH